ncbi:RNA recognition motif. (a.k.a. RRM, RBD, or RNP domain) [Filimonas lacunae]|uniref:RNA recognition motif. (A.k.a. RRM, RBD, or RNP domain) n=1 Tax=Filimonas lacunae TaxID=477680 RepID=A0A173MD60_9BACT|nr:RNA-binding protein [Filimonas lacunae]BAV05523.1 RNA-binding protein [Filimonas lacunae]SIT20575.1 RNA recognition motif. (a.k.a. RRM, RBD, or RNP domain) [Filimonas lacunae]
MNIYVSNLSFGVDTDELVKQFSQYGKVASVNIVTDKFTNQSRGFAFVEMPEQQEAETAIKELNGFTLAGRTIQVNEARPREERPRRDKTFY